MFDSESVCLQTVFGKIPKNHTSYQFQQLPAMLNLTTTTVGASGGGKIQYQLPSDTWFNLRRSFIQYTSEPSASAATYYNWVPKHVHQFKTIKLSITSSEKLVDLDAANVMDRIVKPYCTKEEDLLEKDMFKDGSQSMGEWFRSLGVDYDSTTLQGDFVRYESTSANHSTNRPSVGFREFEYCESESTAAATAGPTHTIKLELGNIQHSFFELDINIKFPVNVIISLEFEQASRLAFCATDQSYPATGATEFTGTVAITDLNFWLAVETNQDLIDKMNTAYDKGIKIPFEFAMVQQVSSNGSPKNQNTDLDDSYGILKRVYSSIQNVNTNSNTLWDINNLSQAKFTSVQTAINAKNIEPDKLYANNLEDYSTMKSKGFFKNSCILNSDIYQYNAAYINSWEDTTTGLCDRDGLYKNFDQGLKFRQMTHVTKFETPATQGIITKVFVFQKTLNLSPNKISIDTY